MAQIVTSLNSGDKACRRKAKMSALSKVEMSVSAPFWEFGGCHFDGHGGDEQARADSHQSSASLASVSFMARMSATDVLILILRLNGILNRVVLHERRATTFWSADACSNL